MIIFTALQLVLSWKNSRLVFPLASVARSLVVALMRSCWRCVRLQESRRKCADFDKVAKPQGKTLLNSNNLQNSKSDYKSLLPICSRLSLSLAVRPLSLAVRLCARLGGGGYARPLALAVYIYSVSKKIFLG